jgi:hypothetical protein
VYGQHGIGGTVQFSGTLRYRRVTLKAQQGVEPQHSAAVALEPKQLLCQFARRTGVQAVGDHQHHRASTDQFARVLQPHLGQRDTQMGSAGKIFDRHTGMRQHGIGIRQTKRGAQVGELGAEGKYITTAMAPSRCVQKRQQQSHIALHRTRNVHQYQQRQGLAFALQARQNHGLAAGAHPLPEHSGPVQSSAASSLLRPPGGKRRQGHSEVTRQALDQAVLGRRKRIEVGVFQAMRVTGGHGRVKVDFLILLLRARLLGKTLLGRQGLTHPRSAFARFGLAFGTGQQL